MEPINLAEMNLKDLKCLAYDLIAQKEFTERQLQTVNQEISIRLQKEQVNGLEKVKNE